jgi:hypothetical protein
VNWREAGAMWLSAADGVIEARVTMDGLYFGQPTPVCFLFLVFFLKRSAFECSACICARSDDDFCFLNRSQQKMRFAYFCSLSSPLSTGEM